VSHRRVCQQAGLSFKLCGRSMHREASPNDTIVAPWLEAWPAIESHTRAISTNSTLTCGASAAFANRKHSVAFRRQASTFMCKQSRVPRPSDQDIASAAIWLDDADCVDAQTAILNEKSPAG